MTQPPAALLRLLFDAAVARALPSQCMPAALDSLPPGEYTVVGAGKAAAAMALEVEKRFGDDAHGMVVVPYGHAAGCRRIEVVEAGHPVPDEAGVDAAGRMLELVSGLGARDRLLCLVSGGGSALLTLPAAGVSLAEKQAITRRLLASGAAIAEINCVRKHLSAIKGGRLAAATRARLTTFVISDVPGNDLSMVASGPTLPDPASGADALAVLERYDVNTSPALRDVLARSAPVKPEQGPVVLLATADDALEAAAKEARAAGHDTRVEGDLTGDARALAREHAALALRAAAGKGGISLPCVILSGGETTVEVHGRGRGGRNGEYALELAIALEGHPRISAIACDTDGIDGNGDNAGAIIGPATLPRAQAQTLDPLEYQSDNDAYGFFERLGDLVFTGPTLTNVNDFRAILVTGGGERL